MPLNHDLERRVARAEQATHPARPDPAAARAHLATIERSLGPDFLAWAASSSGPRPLPTEPRARVDALCDALLAYLAGRPNQGGSPCP